MVKNSPYIYYDLFPSLWKSISDALKVCIKHATERQFDKLIETDPELLHCFPDLEWGPFRRDSHIREGRVPSHRQRDHSFPRFLKLTLRAFEESQRIKVKGAYIIPSPLHIIY